MSEPIKTLETVMREWREIHFDEDACGYDQGTAQQAQDCADALQPVRDALWGLHDEMECETERSPIGDGFFFLVHSPTCRKHRLAAILGEREG